MRRSRVLYNKSNYKGTSTFFRLKTYKQPENSKSILERTVIRPDSTFKMVWDLIIIVLSVYNSILIPYEFAYSLDTNILLDILDRIIDVVFAIDILINFRTAYENSKTGKLVINGKKIALKYILNGRF
jgi:hypothetical protein